MGMRAVRPCHTPTSHFSPACSPPTPPPHHAPREPVHFWRRRGARRRQRAQRGRLQGQLQARRRPRLAQQEAARIPPRVSGLRSTCVLALRPPLARGSTPPPERASSTPRASQHYKQRQCARAAETHRVDNSRQRSCRGAGAAEARLRMAVYEHMSAWGAPMPSVARTPAPRPAPRRPCRLAPGTGPAPDLAPGAAPAPDLARTLWRAAPSPQARVPGLVAPPAPSGPTGWRR